MKHFCLGILRSARPSKLTRVRWLIALSCLLAANWPAHAENSAAEASSPTRTYTYRDRYEVLSEHNIFLRERGRSRARSGYSAPAPPATPEQTSVLTGIVFEDDQYYAYIEDMTRGTVQKLRVGDSVASGQIGDIQIDAIAYDHPGGRTWVDLGSNLTGAPVASVSAARISAVAAAGTVAPVSPTTQSAVNPDTANLSVEERMRLRRMQEMNRQ